MAKSFYEKLIELLKTDSRFVDDQGELVKAAVVDSAWKIDRDLVKLLLSDSQIKEQFFDDIEGHWIFNINTFQEWIESVKPDWEKTFDVIPDILFLLTKDSKILRVNKAAAEFLGSTPQEMVGKECYRLVHGTDTNPFNCPHIRAIRSGKTETAEMEVANGSILSVTCSPVRDGGGQITGTVHVAHDVTERFKMEREILETKNLLENIFENSVDSIGVVDRHGKFLRINKRTEEIFGYSRDDLLGKHSSILYSDSGELEDMLQDLRRDGVIREREMKMLVKSGMVVPMDISIKLLYDDNGNLLGSTTSARDLRERKSLEAQLMQAQKMEAIGVLAGGIAHDFNNLLTTVKGYTQLLLLDDELAKKNKEALQEIERAASRAAELVKHLLTFSRKVEGDLRVLNINDVVENTRRLLQRTIPKFIQVKLDLAPDLHAVKADPVQIEQIILNLAINAKDAMPNGGNLVIKTQNISLEKASSRKFIVAEGGDYVLLSVEDTGFGIPESDIDRIFDPFYSTKEVGKGTGLGLSMVYGIVKASKGFIDVSSMIDSGTTFKIYFPAVGSERKEEFTEEIPMLKGGNERILLVDDEESVAGISTEILSKFGYNVTWAPSGMEALKIFKANDRNFDLVILDYMMPEMDGLTCLKELKAMGNEVKVLFATGFSSDVSVQKLEKESALNIIRKPFNMGELLAMVRHTLDQE